MKKVFLLISVLIFLFMFSGSTLFQSQQNIRLANSNCPYLNNLITSDCPYLSNVCKSKIKEKKSCPFLNKQKVKNEKLIEKISS